ncbi:hypothetical protein BG005_003769 [Podila minutissima]|nr:hypothetical protein BG005_003769 [Podila minutissima]
MWSGNCASMGANAGNVSVQIVNGPASSVQFKGEIGKLDCSGSLTNTIVTIGTDIESGEYSIRVLTLPEPSYSPAFDVVNAALPGTPTATTGAPKPATTTGTGSGASKVVAGSMALAGVVAAMLL